MTIFQSVAGLVKGRPCEN